MNRIDSLFATLRNENHQAFIPFVTAGDPDLDTTVQVVEELVRRGAHIIEIGFPYSDPIADGSVIQASYTRALQNNIRIADIFATIRRLTEGKIVQESGVALVSMVSYSLVFRRGVEKFLDDAQEAGLSGAIVPDIPVEEAAKLAGAANKRDFKLIQLVTPTTSEDRAKQIAQTSTGFLYCVSVTGITGARTELPPELAGRLKWLREQTDLPLCVGFGISQPDQVQMLHGVADGIIVGSALVRLLEVTPEQPKESLVERVGAFAGTLVGALK